MNVFGDADAAAKLTRLKQQIAGLSGQDLATGNRAFHYGRAGCRPKVAIAALPREFILGASEGK